MRGITRTNGKAMPKVTPPKKIKANRKPETDDGTIALPSRVTETRAVPARNRLFEMRKTREPKVEMAGTNGGSNDEWVSEDERDIL